MMLWVRNVDRAQLGDSLCHVSLTYRGHSGVQREGQLVFRARMVQDGFSCIGPCAGMIGRLCWMHLTMNCPVWWSLDSLIS